MKLVLHLVVAVAVAWACGVGIGAAAASQPGPRRLQSDVTKVVSVTGVVHNSPSGLVLKSGKGPYALEGGDLAGYVGKKVVVSGTVRRSTAEKGPRRVLAVSRVERAAEQKD